MQNKRTFVSRFFELFTLPANVKLNTQRRSAPSMCAFKKEERSVLISVTLMKGITGYKITVSTIGITVCKWRVQPCDSDLKDRFLSLIVCLFILSFFLPSTFLVFLLLTFFGYPHFFFHPHFSIRIFPSASAIRRYLVRDLQTPRRIKSLSSSTRKRPKEKRLLSFLQMFSNVQHLKGLMTFSDN